MSRWSEYRNMVEDLFHAMQYAENQYEGKGEDSEEAILALNPSDVKTLEAALRYPTTIGGVLKKVCGYEIMVDPTMPCGEAKLVRRSNLL